MARTSKSVRELTKEWDEKEGTYGVPEWRAFLIDELCKRLNVRPTPDDGEWLDDLLLNVQIQGYLGPKDLGDVTPFFFGRAIKNSLGDGRERHGTPGRRFERCRTYGVVMSTRGGISPSCVDFTTRD